MITLTNLAAEKVQEMLVKRGKGQGIMLGVRTTGCSGLAYKLEYVDHPPVTRDYMTYTCHGVKIWVAGRDMPYLTGMKLDWVRNGLNEGFDFINPNEKARCGCGESFTI